MKIETLLKKVRNATSAEQKLISEILDAPQIFQHSLSEVLSEIKKKKSSELFLQAFLDIAAEVSKEVTISPNLVEKEPFERIIEVLTTKEVLEKLAPSDPLAAARLKGLMVKRELLYQDGQPLKSEEVASLLHLTRQAVDKRRRNGQLLGISLGRRGYLYPVWQFHEEKVLPGLVQVLQELKEYDPWTQLMFFETGDLRLGGATPQERLRAGEIDDVVWAASCYGKQIPA
ncbi:hypothetical protein [Gloeocapsa sp. PCC 73106]|uniref:hypothetical protein n=1 Tax=Gloeocapsa sp. PCC 73106 TaxID=102232 RepID=UPI0002ACD73C|nr:hypothetical protein [Gloeocapsa sp. PCC 73106]ELR97030.1 hypothetical protein GLO73106DRAFT_00008330 [Gloeocapsa sp. PCC 73106]